MMHFFLCLLAFLHGSAAVLQAQTADDYVRSGIQKQQQKNFQGAFDDYTQALEHGDTSATTWYNRGSVALMLEQYDQAIQDLTQAIALAPSMTRAYYNRATAYVRRQQIDDALADLDTVITLDTAFPNALTLRGQIRAAKGNTNGACDDFRRARQLGDPGAEQHIARVCRGETAPEETMVFTWPEGESWSLGDRQEDRHSIVIDYLREGETVNRWTELVNVTTFKGAALLDLDKAVELLYAQAQQTAPDVRRTIVAQDANGAWILFKLEAPRFIGNPEPESQLWYVTRGRQSLITAFRAVKQAALSDEQVHQWQQFFATGRIVPASTVR